LSAQNHLGRKFEKCYFILGCFIQLYRFE
jgi:hypothetical protein